MNTPISRLQKLSRRQKIFFVLSNDFAIAFICWTVFGPPMASFILSEFSSSIFDIIFAEWFSFFIPSALSILYLYFFGFYKSLIKFFDSKDSIFLAISGSLIFGFVWASMHIFQYQIISTSFLYVAILQGLLLSAVFYAFLQLSRDLAQYLIYPLEINIDAKPVIIYGARSSGKELYNSLIYDQSKRVLAFFDNSIHLKGQQINNIPILGSFNDISKLKDKNENLEVLLAVPDISTNDRRKIINELEKLKVSVRSIPSFSQLISDQKKTSDLQNLSLDDILPRARVEINAIPSASNKNFLITGAGGSIGSEICRQLILSAPKRIFLLDVSEYNLFNIEKECAALVSSKNINVEVIAILGDIKEFSSLKNIFSQYEINYVFHAAAYKHVPLVENPINIAQASKNNVLGTYNIAKLALDHDVEKFVMISSDKAVRPTNVMGASKRLSEIVVQSLQDISSNTKFSMVRFGNVINSSGSVIPLFLDQISSGGPVTLTDKEVKRYFMTIPEAANLVLQAAEMTLGGEVFILDMGEQMKIYDLAKKLIHLSGRNVASQNNQQGIEIKEIGLRPGEKMYEELLITGELSKTANPKIYKSSEDYIKHKKLVKILDDLTDCIEKNDIINIKSLYRNFVEGFK